MSASTNYRALAPSEVEQAAIDCQLAWTDPAIPQRQYDVAEPELKQFRAAGACAPFDALVRCLKQLPAEFLNSRPRLLDIGASAGYYSEVLECRGFQFRYFGVDYSSAFKRLAEQLYPGIDFDVADATDLPYEDQCFEIAISGGMLMHVRDYATVISEAARVTSRYVLFHRTPITEGPTSYWLKEAYGVECLEIWFNEPELLGLFHDNGLRLIYQTDVFSQEKLCHRNYLLENEA